MNIPVVKNNNVSEYLNASGIIEETALQIMKDFGLFGVEITFSGNTADAYNELHKQLVEQISVLIDRDYGRLLSVLYQVDITEKEIANAEAELPHYSNIEIIAHQVIVRDLQKVLTRHYFKTHK